MLNPAVESTHYPRHVKGVCQPAPPVMWARMANWAVSGPFFFMVTIAPSIEMRVWGGRRCPNERRSTSSAIAERPRSAPGSTIRSRQNNYLTLG